MVPLVLHSHFSLMWGTASPEALCQAARAMGYGRLALTDLDNLYGLPAFLKACRRADLIPIVGAELTDPADPASAARAVCLVENETGYVNLCRLLTERLRHRPRFAPRPGAAEEGARTGAGLALDARTDSPAGGPAHRHPVGETAPPPLQAGAVSVYRRCFPGASPGRPEPSPPALKVLLPRFHQGLLVLSSQPDLLRAWHAAGVAVAAYIARRPCSGFYTLRKTAQQLGIPLLAAPDSYFLQASDYELHRMLRAIARNTSLSRLTPAELAPPEAWLASPEEYRRRFEVLPEALEATELLAERCLFRGPDTATIFPRFGAPGPSPILEDPCAAGAPTGPAPGREDAASGIPSWTEAAARRGERPCPSPVPGPSLESLAYDGARWRYGEDLAERVVERLEHELRCIRAKGFADYFLVVRDIVRRSPRICGRGSGAASIVAYCLGITNVCPLKFNLYFERFLNPGRLDPLDIDVDFAWDERDGVLATVLEQYRGRAAMVCTHIAFQPRMAIREVAKVLGLPEAEIGRVGERFEWRMLNSRFDGKDPRSGQAAEPFPCWTSRGRGGTQPAQQPLLKTAYHVQGAQGPHGSQAPQGAGGAVAPVREWAPAPGGTGQAGYGSRDPALARSLRAGPNGGGTPGTGHAQEPAAPRKAREGPGARELAQDLRRGEPESESVWERILPLAERLVGIPRHLSVHPGGVIITPQPIDRYVPVEEAAKGVPVIHWEKDGAEEMGLVKIDLLGNRSLAVIRDAIANIRENGRPFDESRWEPEEDEATRQAVARGQTMGCFYIESPAMRLLQEKTGKGDYEHLVIHSSIIRPAANEYIREYVRRLRGGAWSHLHPLLAESLDETYGIMVYQEHVSLAAMALAGFSHSEADQLRKVLSKKDKEHQLADYRARFFEGARARGIPLACLEQVWKMMMSFAGYSFCKPHSASYARVSFQSAYLKVHHPAEFMAAVISNQGGFYSTFAYVSEARRMGLRILPPEVNRSLARWVGRGREVRVGLLALKALSAGTLEGLLRAREQRPFADLAELLERVRPAEDEARALIRCGACDGLAPARDRVELLWELACWQHRRARPAQERRQGTLFEPLSAMEDSAGTLTAAPPPVPSPALATPDRQATPVPADAAALPAFRPTPPLEVLRGEYAVLGFLCDRHPIVLFEEALEGQRIVKAAELRSRIGQAVRIAGWLITGKVVTTSQGEAMEFLTFEDETGLVEATFFPAVYRRFRHLLVTGGPYLVSGTVEEEFGALTLTAGHLARVTADGGRARQGS